MKHFSVAMLISAIIFISIDVGPDYEGKIRDIDVETLEQVGQWIKEQ